MKRSQQKKITKKAKVLKFMRKSRQIRQLRAAKFCNISESAIGHYEHGRMDISEEKLVLFLSCYGYTQQQYEAMLLKDDLPVNLKEECLNIISDLDQKRIGAVYAMLSAFTQQTN